MTWEGLSPPYATIVADPPWPLKWNGGAGGLHRNATPLRYSLMALEEPRLTDDCCSLALFEEGVS